MEDQVWLMSRTHMNCGSDLLSDTLKGSYYANPVIDRPQVSQALREAYPEYYGSNICDCVSPRHTLVEFSRLRSGPREELKGVHGFEDAFKDLGRYLTFAHINHLIFTLTMIEGSSSKWGAN